MYPAIETLSIDRAESSVIWLHGLGASGDDFVDIVGHLDLSDRVRFVFPHAPVQAVTINGGMMMPSWFDILGLDRHSEQDEQGLERARQAIIAMVQHEIDGGIAPENIVLMGFSQGGALALYAGCTAGLPLAGVIGLSTYLPLLDNIEAMVGDDPAVPVAMAHGLADDIVDSSYGERSAEHLSSLGFEVDWQTYPCAHELCWAEIEQIGVWLQSMLKL